MQQSPRGIGGGEFNRMVNRFSLCGNRNIALDKFQGGLWDFCCLIKIGLFYFFYFRS